MPITPTSFDPEPHPDYMIYITDDGTLRLGARIHEALAASGYAIVRTGVRIDSAKGDIEITNCKVG